MNTPAQPDPRPATPDASALTCAACRLPLQPGKVQARYLGSQFEVELPHCPGCGFVYVSEALALGKMLQVEQALEDK